MSVHARWIKPILALVCLAAILSLAPLVLAQDGPVVVINAGALNQRTGPGPQYAIQGVLAGGRSSRLSAAPPTGRGGKSTPVSAAAGSVTSTSSRATAFAASPS